MSAMRSGSSSSLFGKFDLNGRAGSAGRSPIKKSRAQPVQLETQPLKRVAVAIDGFSPTPLKFLTLEIPALRVGD
jgi:hypothetical protein